MRAATVTRVPARAERPTYQWEPARGQGGLSLRLYGLLGSRELERVSESVQERCRSPRDLVWIDFTDVVHLDFRALAEFVQSQERQRRRGASIWFTGLTPYLRALFQVAGQGPALNRLEWRVPEEGGGRMGREDALRSYGSAPNDGSPERVEI
ncbi:MAG TPA: STAS domain-containing protein [Candidatus Eisenbacteria bacterium]|nr:STAS domain-containing protein [Candidatus Eisenbacteria bacterium]